MLSAFAIHGQASASGHCVDGTDATPGTCLCISLRELVETSAEATLARQADTDFIKGKFSVGYLESGDSAGVKSCSILEDAAKSTFQCVWTYSLQSSTAQQHYLRASTEIQHCLAEIFGGELTLQQDQAVNHPDVYASQYYRHADGQITVSLKNKSALNSKLLTIRVDTSIP